jgi:TonB family protein
MPGRSWDSDVSYRKRLALIVPAVLVILLGVVLLSRHVPATEIYKYVGWRGELELLPEITIIPDEPAPEALPAPEKSQPREQTVALELADAPGEFEANPPRIERPQQEQLAPVFDDFSDFPSARREHAPVSYSDKYVLLRMVKPRYPPEQLAEGIEGNVTVELLVNEKGYVETASVLTSLGPEAFEKSALEAARQFVFQPPTGADGKPTTMWVKFLIKFRVFG